MIMLLSLLLIPLVGAAVLGGWRGLAKPCANKLAMTVADIRASAAAT